MRQALTSPTREPDYAVRGIEFAQANSDFLVDGYVATSSQDASLDCHGAHNHYGVLRNFDVDTRCKIGNVSFPAGDQNIRVENGVCGKALEIQGGSGDMIVSNVSAWHLQLTTIRGFTSFYPHDCEYISCTFTNEEDEFYENNNCLTCAMSEGDGSGDAFRRFTNQVFQLCSFVQEHVATPSWTVFFEALGLENGFGTTSDATFYKCFFSNVDSQPLVQNESQQVDSEITLVFDDCWFDSIANERYSQRYKVDSAGVCTIERSTFVTDFPSPPPEFVLDESSGGMTITLNDNTIMGH